MKPLNLPGLVWYRDPGVPRAEPGIRHSFMASLATAINYVTGELDPVWLMGASGFAFRIEVHEVLCLSAMSTFDWSVVLPEAVQNTGFRCTHVSRSWNEEDQEAQRRDEAHNGIVEGLLQGRPAVVWDVADGEWGLIVGYDQRNRVYEALSSTGEPVTMEVDRLGRNGIDILSVVIPGSRNDRTDEDMVRNSLHVAVDHAEGLEWTARPDYTDGLAAFEPWATIHDRAAVLVETKRAFAVSHHVITSAKYYAEHYYSARRYAYRYLAKISDQNPELLRASASYARVALSLRSVWERVSRMTRLDDADLLRGAAADIREAFLAEREAIDILKSHIGPTGSAEPASSTSYSGDQAIRDGSAPSSTT